MFSCFVLPCLFFPEAIPARYKSLQGAGKSSCGSLRPGPSNQVVYQTLPGTGKTTTAQAVFASIFQKQPPKVLPALELPCVAEKNSKMKGMSCTEDGPPPPQREPFFHFCGRMPGPGRQARGLQTVRRAAAEGPFRACSPGPSEQMTSSAWSPADTQQWSSILSGHQRLQGASYETDGWLPPSNFRRPKGKGPGGAENFQQDAGATGPGTTPWESKLPAWGRHCGAVG